MTAGCQGASTVPKGSAPCPTNPGTDGHTQGAVRPSLRAAPCPESTFPRQGVTHNQCGFAGQGANRRPHPAREPIGNRIRIEETKP
jgi:hypothetical protein